jgi:hypothetical protein
LALRLRATGSIREGPPEAKARRDANSDPGMSAETTPSMPVLGCLSGCRDRVGCRRHEVRERRDAGEVEAVAVSVQREFVELSRVVVRDERAVVEDAVDDGEAAHGIDPPRSGGWRCAGPGANHLMRTGKGGGGVAGSVDGFRAARSVIRTPSTP